MYAAIYIWASCLAFASHVSIEISSAHGRKCLLLKSMGMPYCSWLSDHNGYQDVLFQNLCKSNPFLLLKATAAFLHLYHIPPKTNLPLPLPYSPYYTSASCFSSVLPRGILHYSFLSNRVNKSNQFCFIHFVCVEKKLRARI